MAIFHYHIKIIGRSKGKSSVSSSAYINGAKMKDLETGRTFSYEKKKEIVYSALFLCENAPPEWGQMDIKEAKEHLWNEVLKVEKASNAQLARSLEFALPKEWSRQQQIDYASEYIRENFVSKGKCADWVIHDKGKGNPHIHCLLTMRPFKEDHTWGAKEKKAYLLDENGERIPVIDPKTGQQKLGKRNAKVWKRGVVDSTGWNNPKNCTAWRKAWADKCNAHLKEEEQIDHRSHHIQKPITFEQCMGYSAKEIHEIFCSKRYRKNTGTYLMTDSLAKMIKGEWIYPHELEKIKEEKIETVVTNAFHCMSPEFVFDTNYWKRLLELDVRIVPMTLGFRYHQNGEFYLSDDMVYILKAISERNQLGVRGEICAEILNDYGITNVKIVGCPSLFYHLDANFSMNHNNGKIKKVNFNFNQCYKDFFQSHIDFCKHSLPVFLYFYNLFKEGNIDVQYTLQTYFAKEYFSYDNFWRLEDIIDFPKKKGTYYFSVDDWIDGIKECDFSMGTQFHGNMAAVLSKVPTLFIVIDNRMKELCDVMKLPYIMVEEFDKNKSIEEYRDIADYSEFNASYEDLYQNFISYCVDNGVELRE